MAIQWKDLTLEELLNHYKESHAEAFREFYGRTDKLVYNYLKMRVQNRNDVDDIFQDTYFRLHKYITTYDPSKKAIHWLLSIAKNVMIDHFNVKNKVTLLDEDVLKKIKSPLQSDDRLLFFELLREVESQLSQEELSLLVLRFFEGASIEEVSDEFKISPVNARQRISRLMRKLRATLVPEKKLTKKSS